MDHEGRYLIRSVNNFKALNLVGDVVFRDRKSVLVGHRTFGNSARLLLVHFFVEVKPQVRACVVVHVEKKLVSVDLDAADAVFENLIGSFDLSPPLCRGPNAGFIDSASHVCLRSEDARLFDTRLGSSFRSLGATPHAVDDTLWIHRYVELRHVKPRLSIDVKDLLRGN